ncbi:SDR family NAD(P)-dependent oxidoreductase [Agrobacterium vitis]|uniref:SDR family NAD(P)-dependent oxidoreductase n=1 Tax=Agrobacterium vitis TaxID=373 RepID=UPI003D2CB4C1
MHKSDSVPRTILITGASGGIGRTIARSFAQDGNRLLLVGRRPQELEETARLVRERGAEAKPFVVDVCNEAALIPVFETIDRLDVAINAAGVLASGALDEMDESAFSRVFSINVLGLWLSMKHEIRLMKKSGGGAIINIGSNVGAKLVRPTMGAYAASKAAVSSLTRTAALEAIAHGIRVNAICPGPVDTTMSFRPGEDRDARDSRIATVNPSKRVAQPEEIAATAHWLASEVAAYIVGQDIIVDGGAST